MSKHLKQHIALFKYLAKRLYYARKRKKALVVAVFIAINCIITQWYAGIVIYPNTYLGHENVSHMTEAYVNKRVNSILTAPYKLRVGDREYTYTYKDLGVVIDRDRVLSEIFAPNRKPFPVNILLLVPSLFISRTVPIPLVFTQDFYQFIDRSVFDFGDPDDVVQFDQNDKSLVFLKNEEKYIIDSGSFEKLLASRIENNTIPLYPKLTKVNSDKADTIANVSDRIKSIFLQPMTVFVDLGGTTKSFILTERELADIARVTWSDARTDASVSLNSTTAMYMINEHIKKTGILARGNIATQKVLRDLEDAITARFNGHMVEAITISYDRGPNSDGLAADRYIEVDISQQKMYLFRGGREVKSYRVSTGLEYPTPTGEFTILNKVGLGFSTIYDVWMPWWMGFKYSDELHAYFGIHELPYKLSGDNKIQRPANFIGRPNTGGCVALGVGDAREVYQFADVGTKVLIFH